MSQFLFCSGSLESRAQGCVPGWGSSERRYGSGTQGEPDFLSWHFAAKCCVTWWLERLFFAGAPFSSRAMPFCSSQLLSCLSLSLFVRSTCAHRLCVHFRSVYFPCRLSRLGFELKSLVRLQLFN